MQQPQRILICPLDWGLGHATRCIPVIRAFLEQQAEVLIAADGRPYELLKQEFPALQFVRFKGYDIRYPSSGSMAISMLLSIPKILAGIKREQRELEKIIQEHKIDTVISDNRYGCWNKNVRSIFITHQLMVKSPFGEALLHRIILSYIKKYDECWIPDHASENNLSGDLSHKYPLPGNAFFIGPLSRFGAAAKIEQPAQYDVMAIISGPEPQRSIFEKTVSEQLFQSNLKALIVFGIPEGKAGREKKGRLEMASHLSAGEMEKAILSSSLIISRSGYSTIMDLAALSKKAVFIPTPGQTEQEYLAGYFSEKKVAYFQEQREFNLDKALKEAEKFSGFKNVEAGDLLRKRIIAGRQSR
ncbi:MAG: hypothetical protein JWO09_3838 [Bacteroidetes bacterium]|nr:hypothetical protein [Bacteroidota bacterium]